MMLDPNAATVADLTAIPGVTQPIADALVASRPYANNAAVDRVLAKHISEPARDSVYARLWMPIDLNTAPAAEILLIPGSARECGMSSRSIAHTIRSRSSAARLGSTWTLRKSPASSGSS